MDYMIFGKKKLSKYITENILFVYRYCENDYNECGLPDICHPEVTCQDKINAFKCECGGRCDETYCDCREEGRVISFFAVLTVTLVHAE